MLNKIFVQSFVRNLLNKVETLVRGRILRKVFDYAAAQAQSFVCSTWRLLWDLLVAFYGISPRGKCLIISILHLQFSASILSHFPSFLRPSGGSRGGGRRSTKERWWRPPVSTTRLHHCGAGSVARAAARSIGAHLDPALTQSLSKRGEREVERLEEQEEGRLISTLAARDRMLPAQVAKDPDLHPVVVVLHHPAHMAAPHFAPFLLLLF